MKNIFGSRFWAKNTLFCLWRVFTTELWGKMRNLKISPKKCSDHVFVHRNRFKMAKFILELLGLHQFDVSRSLQNKMTIWKKSLCWILGPTLEGVLQFIHIHKKNIFFSMRKKIFLLVLLIFENFLRLTWCRVCKNKVTRVQIYLLKSR